MAKITFEFKRDFSQKLNTGMVDGIKATVSIEYEDDKNSPAGALTLLMGIHHEEFTTLAMQKLVELLRQKGQDADCGIYPVGSQAPKH